MQLAQTLTPDNQHKTVYSQETDGELLEIKQSDKTTWLLVDHVVQTAIENRPPFRSLLSHNYLMMMPLNFEPEPKTILELGGGGLAINRYLRHSRPEIDVTSIESNLAIINAVERHFPTTYPLKVIHADASDFIAQAMAARQTFDWLIIDLFNGPDFSPDISLEKLLPSAHQLLNNDGYLIMNILDTSDNTVSRLNQLCQANFAQTPMRFAVENMQNQIIILKQGAKSQIPDKVTQFDLNRTLS